MVKSEKDWRQRQISNNLKTGYCCCCKIVQSNGARLSLSKRPNYLTISLVLIISLFAFALAASSARPVHWRNSAIVESLPQDSFKQSAYETIFVEPTNIVTRIREPPQQSLVDLTADTSRLVNDNTQLRKADNLVELAEAAAVAARDNENTQNSDDDDDDEQFLRQLKVAAKYLDEKLYEQQRVQQQQQLKSSVVEPNLRLSYSRPSGLEEPAFVSLTEQGRQSNGQLDDQLATRQLYSVDEPEHEIQFANDLAALQAKHKQQPLYITQSLLDNSNTNLNNVLVKQDKTPPNDSDDNHSDTSRLLATKRKDVVTTTLLESDGDNNQDHSSEQAAKKQQITTTTSTPTPSLVVTNDDHESRARNQHSSDEMTTTTANQQQTGSSIFNRMYGKLSAYLPFLHQLNILRHANDSTVATTDNEPVDLVSKKSSSSPEASLSSTPTILSHKLEESKNGVIEENISVGGGGGGKRQTKPSVVSVTATRDKQAGGGAKKVLSVRVDVNGELEGSEDKSLEGNFIDEPLDLNPAPTTTSQDVVVKSALGGKSDETIEGERDHEEQEEELDLAQMVPVRHQEATIDNDDDDNSLVKKINFIKSSSNLMVPLRAPADELFGGADMPTHAGKYIYAPTQHYYLNSMPTTGAHAHLNAKHLSMPGNELYGGPYEPFKAAAYAFQKDHRSGATNMLVDNNKTNDLYFLVMVGAFCVMAMAVVLAAGMFAYRVQQQRKSSQEAEYPTYGVVGPNSSMSGKCGAASFMGGYFGNGGGGPAAAAAAGLPSSYTATTKASTKHLADLYASNQHDNGLKTLDKSSQVGCNGTSTNMGSKKGTGLTAVEQQGGRTGAPPSFIVATNQDAARMYHYQHQKQQMIISDRSSAGRHTSASDLDSEDENDDGSYTVYECPGLASAHEMEIKNPLFNDDQSP